MNPVPIVLLASGTGTLAQAVIDSSRQPDSPVVVAGLLSDRPGCGAVRRASESGLPVAELDPSEWGTRSDWDAALAAAAGAMQPDWVISVGFMRLLGQAFLSRFLGHIVNSHPALLPAFPGAHAVRDALAYGVKVTGCTVHLVDEGVDTGPVLAQEAVDVFPDDTEDALHERIKITERRLIVEVIRRLATSGYSLTGRRATLL